MEGRGSGWQVCRESHPDGVWEVTGTVSPPSSGAGSTVLLFPPSGLWEEPCSPAGRTELLFLPGMAPMGCQSSGGAAVLVLLEILGRQPLLLVPAPAESSPASQAFSPPFHVRKRKPKTSQNHLPPWLKVQMEGFLFCLSKQTHSVLGYHCGVFMRETGSTKSHFSPQHRQETTERSGSFLCLWREITERGAAFVTSTSGHSGTNRRYKSKSPINLKGIRYTK